MDYGALRNTWIRPAVQTIVLDIETEVEHIDYKKYGLMVQSPITFVSFYSPFMDEYLTLEFDYSEEQLGFIRDLLSRESLLIVGHNVIFDMRHLGVHCGFQLHHTTLVHDTYALAIRLLWGDSDDPRSLEYYAEFILDDADLNRYKSMKRVRSGDGETDQEDWLWYVQTDVYVTHVLYEAQVGFVESAQFKDTEVPFHLTPTRGGSLLLKPAPIVVPRWPRVNVLFSSWRNLLRESVNQAIRGVDVDVEFLDYKLKDSASSMRSSALEVFRRTAELCLQTEYRGIIDFLRYTWLTEVAGMITSAKSNINIKAPAWWLTEYGDLGVEFSPGHTYKRDVMAPIILPLVKAYTDLSAFNGVRYDLDLGAEFMSVVKSFKGGDLNDLLNVQKFHRLLIDVLAKVPMPNNDELAAHAYLLTEKGARSYSKDAMDYYLGAEHPYPRVSECDPDGYGILTEYRKYMDSKALYLRFKELRQHVYNGRIHSLIGPFTRAGRDSSSLPNLQNIPLGDFAGVFVGPVGATLVEFDYSNAESVMGAAIGKDDAFAKAVMGSDFHMAMAEVYWPEKVKSLREIGDKKALKDLRKASKAPTFAIPYGAGPARIAEELGCTLQEAQAIMDARKRAFPAIENAKRLYAANCRKRYEAGYVPYVPLWDESRVSVPVYHVNKSGQQFKTPQIVNGEMVSKPEIVTHAQWNYLQQGGVAALIHEAVLQISKAFVDQGFKSYIALNIHDSIIVAIYDDEVDLVASIICNIMGSVAPDSLTRRTMPYITFSAEYCPRSNAKKWGYRHNIPYPHDLRYYANKYGFFPYEEGQDEAPVWKWDERLFHSLEDWTEWCRLDRDKPENPPVDQKADISIYSKYAFILGDVVISQYHKPVVPFTSVNGTNQEYVTPTFDQYMTAIKHVDRPTYERVLSELHQKLLTIYPDLVKSVQYAKELLSND